MPKFPVSRRATIVVVTAGLLLLAASTAVAIGAPRNFAVPLAADNEVPANVSNAHGVAKLQLSPDGLTMSYRLIASNIDNVVQAHIHIGPPGVDVNTPPGLNAPVAVFLFGPVAPGGGAQNGVLSVGSFTAANFTATGPLAGQPMSALIQAIEENRAYVNVHTNDGVAPVTNLPGDIPGGEIRGPVPHH